MGVPKGTDNFKGFRDARTGATLALVRAELKKVARKRFATVESLVVYLAPRVNLDRRNLKRNAKYFRVIVNHWKAQPGASQLALNSAPPEVRTLAHQLTDAQLAQGRMKGLLDEAEARLRQQARLREAPSSEQPTDFADTVWALRAVLDRINAYGDVIFEVDFALGEIRDIAAAPNQQTVVSGKRLRPFLAAYKRLLDQESGAES